MSSDEKKTRIYYQEPALLFDMLGRDNSHDETRNPDRHSRAESVEYIITIDCLSPLSEVRLYA